MNKRGIESGMIVLIVVIVLVLLVGGIVFIAFNGSFTNFMNWLNGGRASQSNIDNIRSECEASCSTTTKAAYCQDIRTVNFGSRAKVYDEPKFEADGKTLVKSSTPIKGFDGVTSIKATCAVLANKAGKINDYEAKAFYVSGLTVDFDFPKCAEIPACVTA